MEKNQSESKCQARGRPYLIGYDDTEKKAIFFRPNCGKWTCSHCGKERSGEWFLNAVKGVGVLMAEGWNVDMITLTGRGGRGRTPAKSIRDFRAAFPKLSRRAAYHNQRWTYLAIPEQHMDGVMHLHILATNEKSAHWWHGAAYKTGLGYKADVREVESPALGGYYVSKYLAKHLEFLNWPKGFRRVRTSRDWPKVDRPAGDENLCYEAYNRYGDAIWNVHILADAGYQIVDLVGRDREI